MPACFPPPLLRVTFLSTLAAAAISSAAVTARANGVEAQVALGPSVQASSWRGDRSLNASLKVGLRIHRILALDALTRLGYAQVDDRMLTYLSLGSTLYGKLGRTQPWIRLAAVHQHEESRAAIAEQPTGALFGVGDGIRHRGGGSLAIGLDVPVAGGGRGGRGHGGVAQGIWFPDPRGPQLYAGGGGWMGANFDL
jgi:hypothetical protein